MSKTRNESIFEGMGISVLAFLIVEIVIENLYGWTRGLLEFVRLNPDAPNLLQLYYGIQMEKGAISMIVFFILLAIFKWKLNVEINGWYVISIFPSSLLYFIYIYTKYPFLFPVT